MELLRRGLGVECGLLDIFKEFASIDAGKATARYPEDTKRILQIMEKSDGVGKVKIFHCSFATVASWNR